MKESKSALKQFVIPTRAFDTMTRAMDTMTRALGTMTRALDTMTRDLDAMTRALDTMTRALDTMTRALDTMTRALDTMTSAMNTMTSALDTMTRALNTMTRALGTMIRALDTMTRALHDDKSYRIDEKDGFDPDLFLVNVKQSTTNLLVNGREYKVKLILLCMMEKDDLKGCEVIAKEAAFHFKTELNLESTNSNESFSKMKETVLESLAKFQRQGSN